VKATTPASEVGRLRAEIADLLRSAGEAGLSTAARKSLNSEIRQAIAELDGFLQSLDPIRQPASVFDPSNPKVIGRFVALALVAQERLPLVEVPQFYGSGVYAVYYRGGFDLYRGLSGTETPLYVGQAAPADRNARTATEQGARLSARLNEHRKNIAKATSTLDIGDFDYRALVVQSGWEIAAEDYLIHLFKPLWNNETAILYGLGKHGDSATTRTNKRAPWDTMHPGRGWAAATIEDAKTEAQIVGEVRAHVAAHPAFASLESVLASFIDELRQ
jgi:hypothetical protein